MGFARVADRNRHELKHYDGRFVCPYGVDNCRVGSERFGRLDTFKRHLRIVHGDTLSSRHSGDDDESRPAGPGRPRRRARSQKISVSNEKLECCNCNRTYLGVGAFIGHLNDCTYALMHPGEIDDEGAPVTNESD